MIYVLQVIYRKWLSDYRISKALRSGFLLLYFRYRQYRLRPRVAFDLIHHPGQFAEAAYLADCGDNLVLSNASVIGFTRVVYRNGQVLYEEDFGTEAAAAVHRDYLYQEETHGAVAAPSAGKMLLPKFRPSASLAGTWVSTMTAASNNWMHWLSETLPRLERILSTEDSREFGLLIDEALPENHRQVLDVIAPGLRRHSVPMHECLQVERLIVPGRPGSGTAFWPRKPGAGTGWYQFDREGLHLVRNRLLRQFASPAANLRRVFVRRKSHFRTMSNQDAVEKLLRERNFEVIEPGEMSVAQQVRMFGEASLVVAQAGAALANIAFMPANAKIICLAAKSPHINYDYFKDFASAFDLNFTYLLGQIGEQAKYDQSKVGRKEHPTNAEFSCPEQALCELVDQLT